MEIELSCPKCNKKIYIKNYDITKCSCGLECVPFDRCSEDYSNCWTEYEWVDENGKLYLDR